MGLEARKGRDELTAVFRDLRLLLQRLPTCPLAGRFGALGASWQTKAASPAPITSAVAMNGRSSHVGLGTLYQGPARDCGPN